MTALREQRRFNAPLARAGRSAGNSCPRRRSPRASRAFTLVELLIAIAILGVGITMAAALFPTAIKQNERSANDTIGMIVAKNALAVAKAKVTVADPNVATIGDNFQDIGAGGLELLTEADLTYPVPRQPAEDFDGGPGEPNDWNDTQDRPLALRGAVVLGRRFDPSRNDFQLVIVSFAKQHSANTIELIGPFGVTINQDGRDWAEVTVHGAAPTAVQRGGVVIFDYDPANSDIPAGRFARIRATRTGGLAVLDRKFDDGDVAGLNAQAVWLVVERDAITDDVVGGWSPVTSVLVTRTALRDQ